MIEQLNRIVESFIIAFKDRTTQRDKIMSVVQTDQGNDLILL